MPWDGHEEAVMPDLAINRVHERLVLTRLTIDVSRRVHKTYLPNERFGTALDLMVVGFAVFIGQAEQRPMTAVKIAAWLEMPRSTVLRKLDQLQRLGIVERRGHAYYMPMEKLNGEPADRCISDCSRMIQKAGTKLSKMDT
jgi:IclR helix-turn-helix domain